MKHQYVIIVNGVIIGKLSFPQPLHGYQIDLMVDATHCCYDPQDTISIEMVPAGRDQAAAT